MKHFIWILSLAFLLFSCDTGKKVIKGEPSGSEVKNDTIRISNPDLEYEIIIIEPGFDSWLITQKPRNYYSLNYLENKNRIYTYEYNNRVHDHRYSTKLYTQEIYYDPTISYGLEVNYLLYNYFIYFMEKYKQKL